MNTAKMPQAINHDRRHFLGAAAAAVIAANLSLARSAVARPSIVTPTAVHATLPASFASIKQIDARLLSIGYAEAGPADGPEVVLLHGWPYDIHSFADVAPLLASPAQLTIFPGDIETGTPLSSTTIRDQARNP